MVAWKQYEESQNNRSTLPHQLDKMWQNMVVEKTLHENHCGNYFLCTHQEIVLRGHDESSSSSNFLTILEFLGRHDEIVQEDPNNAKYVLSQIQNELLDSMGQTVRK